MSLTRRHTKKKKCRRFARKKSEKSFARAKKEGDSLENEWTLSLLSASLSLSLSFFFLAPLVATKSTSLLNNKNYGRVESQRYARDALARLARDVLDREMRSIAPSSFVFVAELFPSRSNAETFSEKEFDQSSLLLSLLFFEEYLFVLFPFFEFRRARARARFYIAKLTHSLSGFLSFNETQFWSSKLRLRTRRTRNTAR